MSEQAETLAMMLFRELDALAKELVDAEQDLKEKRALLGYHYDRLRVTHEFLRDMGVEGLAPLPPSPAEIDAAWRQRGKPKKRGRS